MSQSTILILAAGLGSRYGGFKQIEPVGPHGTIILDYSLYDAWRAGFTNATLVIQPHMEEMLRARLEPCLDGRMTLNFAYQRLDDLPSGAKVPTGREKPWGTGHAVLAAREIVNTPFAVINADDFYGRQSFEIINRFLCDSQRVSSATVVPTYVIAAYKLAATLSEHGTVARGICGVSNDGFLTDVDEKTDIRTGENGMPVCGTSEGGVMSLAPETPVSLNTWGFTPVFFNQLQDCFQRFLMAHGEELKTEFYLPTAVAALINSGMARVKVEFTPETWFGVTYREDRPLVVERIRKLIAADVYPSRLWT